MAYGFAIGIGKMGHQEGMSHIAYLVINMFFYLTSYNKKKNELIEIFLLIKKG